MHPIYHEAGDRSQIRSGTRYGRGAALSPLHRMLTLLRFSHIPLTAFRLSVAGCSGDLVEDALQRSFGGTGCIAPFGGNEVLFVYLGQPGTSADSSEDRQKLHRQVLRNLERQLRQVHPDRGAIEIDTACVAVWSDEITEARDLVGLLLSRTVRRYIVTNPMADKRRVRERGEESPPRITMAS